MPKTATKTDTERIAELEQQVEDLASFVGRVTAGIFGDNFEKYDCRIDGLLVWKQEVVEDPPDDPLTIAWWEYDSGQETDDAR